MGADRVPWADLSASLDWRQGEHVSVLGPTGSGKSHLCLALLPRRTYVCILANKTRDSTLDRLTKRGGGYRRIRKWPPPVPARFAPRVVLWPRPSSLATAAAEQGEVFFAAMDGIYGAGGWTIFVDECYYVAKVLGLEVALKVLWQQGRSAGISIVSCSQRPAYVPLEMYSQATHVFCFRSADRRDLNRLGEVGNVDSSALADTVRNLARYEFAYVDARSGSVTVSRVDPG